MSNILVTGSEGSLMQETIPLLLAQGHTVIGVDNLMRHGNKGNIVSDEYHFFGVDASNEYDMDIIFRNTPIDYVIQAAASIYGVGGFNANCGDILNKDLKIQANMLILSVKYNIKKFVYISSSMVYERIKEDDGQWNMGPIESSVHDDGLIPFTDYGLSKLVGERMVLSYAKQKGLDYIIWRPFNIITPKEIGGHTPGYSHVFADYIQQIIGEKVSELPIIGDGEQIRCFTWIGEVAQAIADYSFQPTEHSFYDTPEYNIGNPEPVTMKELANKIKTIGHSKGLCDNTPLTFKTAANYTNDVKVRIPKIKKIQKRFGFTPKINLEASLRDCITYYSRHNIKW